MTTSTSSTLLGRPIWYELMTTDTAAASATAQPAAGFSPPDRDAPRLSCTRGGIRIGIGGGLKNRCPKGRVGSSPTRRTETA